MDLLQFGLTAFVTLLVVVDPVGVAPIYLACTRELEPGARHDTLLRAIVVALAVTLFFLLGGRLLLIYLGVSVHAFAISGGILLFATAVPMLFGHRPMLQGPERGDYGKVGEDLAVFPLAIPLLSGPGAIASTLLLTSQADGDYARLSLLAVVIVLVFGIAWALLRAADSVMARLGEGKIHILTRVLGIVLAALAVQYVLDGAAGYYRALTA
jgi:multiple antibiotic resistance protein